MSDLPVVDAKGNQLAATVPDEAVAIVAAPNGRWAYRGKAGCQIMMCTRDGNPDRCYGWHCGNCDGPSNCQGDCSCLP